MVDVKHIDPRLNSECSSNSVSVTSYKPKHPRIADVERRLLTYSCWPRHEPEPLQLAECGFYFSGVADVVICFFCDGKLGNWEPNDDPWFEHAKFFPECSFLKLAKSKHKHSLKIKSCGKSLIDQEPLVHNLSSLETNYEVVQQALNIFPKDLALETANKIKTAQLESETTQSASSVDPLLCKVCMDKEKGAVFQPCGHIVTCWNCASMIADCPVCRRSIAHKIRAYVS